MDLTQLVHQEKDLLRLTAGQPLFQVGDTADRMYVLMSGEAEVQVRGRVVEKATVGAILGEMSLIDRSPRSATVMARTDCSLLPIDERSFAFLVQRAPNFALHVMRVMADRLRRADAWI